MIRGKTHYDGEDGERIAEYCDKCGYGIVEYEDYWETPNGKVCAWCVENDPDGVMTFLGAKEKRAYIYD